MEFDYVSDLNNLFMTRRDCRVRGTYAMQMKYLHTLCPVDRKKSRFCQCLHEIFLGLYHQLSLLAYIDSWQLHGSQLHGSLNLKQTVISLQLQLFTCTAQRLRSSWLDLICEQLVNTTLRAQHQVPAVYPIQMVPKDENNPCRLRQKASHAVGTQHAKQHFQ